MAPPATIPLDLEAISGICGSISIAALAVVFSPQIIQQFRQGNADGLSIRFVILWLLGDAFNILGAVLQGVLPTMLILAVYYALTDMTLLCQCFYYRGLTWHDASPKTAKPAVGVVQESSERTPLLVDGDFVERSEADWTALSPAVPHVAKQPGRQSPMTTLQVFASNTIIMVMVCAAGVFGWFLSERAAGEEGGFTSNRPESREEPSFSTLGQVFGCLCALAYIGSRLPQLVLNWRRKTTEGLSMLFFLFTCLGNMTFVLAILCHEPKCREDSCKPGERLHLYGLNILIKASWLAGSFLTLLLDLCVFVQYFVYKTERERIADEEPVSATNHCPEREVERDERGQGQQSMQEGL